MPASGLLLASASPRRLALLQQIGIVPSATCATDIDESVKIGETPSQYVNRIALAKAMAGADRVAAGEAQAHWILAADTAVVVGRRILGKPKHADEADGFLQLLSGRRHRVLTAVVLLPATKQARRQALSISRVKMLALDAGIRRQYIESGEWQGKAGGYALQGLAAAWVVWISGSYTGIIGLPLYETARLLRWAGFTPNVVDKREKTV